MKTKEEILEYHLLNIGYFLKNIHPARAAALNAMEEYASQKAEKEAGEFMEWIEDRIVSDSWFKFDCKIRKWYGYMEGRVTSKDLYQKFLSTRKQPK